LFHLGDVGEPHGSYEPSVAFQSWKVARPTSPVWLVLASLARTSRNLGAAMEQQADELLGRVETDDVAPEVEGRGLPLDRLGDPRIGFQDQTASQLHGVGQRMLAFFKPGIDVLSAAHRWSAEPGSGRIRSNKMARTSLSRHHNPNGEPTNPDLTGNRIRI
jgi:hypothetical protein